jgi:SulP family sulfate permease
MRFFDFSNLRGDIFGGLTAGIVALPLALAFGEASGAGAMAGLYGAIFVGFFASLFGGTSTQVSGPTGPMVVVFAGLFASMSGDVGLVFASVVLAGVLQIIMGVFRLGEYIKLVPYPVISGFMSGIGVIIIALQGASLFGHEIDGGGTINALAAIPAALANPNYYAFGLGVLSLLVVFMWPKRISAYIPGALAALIIGTGLGLLTPGVPVLGAIPTSLPEFVLPVFSKDTAMIALEAAFILAILGSIDSLLTSLVADNMTRTRHKSNKELIGQGIGNTVAGLFGAVPGAGATMRTVINIRSGGNTRISGMIHALFLLAVILGLGPYAAHIPDAVLAGILIKVGYDIIDLPYLLRAHKGPRWDLVLVLVVLCLTVFVDLITAVVVGVVLAALAFVRQIAEEQLDNFEYAEFKDLSEAEKGILKGSEDKVIFFGFSGPLSFGAAADLAHKAREKAKDHTSAMILSFAGVPFIDVSAARAYESIVLDAHYSGRDVYTYGMNDKVRETITGLNSDHVLVGDGHFKRRIDAIKAALNNLVQEEPAEIALSDLAREGV